MRRRTHHRRIWLVISAGLALVLSSAGAQAAGAPGTQAWASRLHGSYDEGVSAVAMSPDGTRVFVTGDSSDDIVTVAYDTATGVQLWLARFGHYATQEVPNAIAISPDGSRLFVTGEADAAGGSSDFATVAYDTTTGAQAWVARYDGGSYDIADAIAVSADGARIFVTGQSFTAPNNVDYVTVAYTAASGTPMWTATYDGPARSSDTPEAIAVSPDGLRVYVTGASYGTATVPGLPLTGSMDYATVAYDAGTGAQAWVARYNGPEHRPDAATALAVSPDGTRVYVAGFSRGLTGYGFDYVTVAYDTSLGVPAWVGVYPGNSGYGGAAAAIAVSPDGSRVFVTGQSLGLAIPELDLDLLNMGFFADYVTIAYDTLVGAPAWIASHNGPTNRSDRAVDLAVSPDGAQVYVTGASTDDPTLSDLATIAYDVATGVQAWVGRYDGPGSRYDRAVGVVVTPDGSRVIAAGSSFGGDATGYDFVTVAYEA